MRPLLYLRNAGKCIVDCDVGRDCVVMHGSSQALGFMNDVARADYTVSISVIGLIAVWFRKHSPCYLVSSPRHRSYLTNVFCSVFLVPRRNVNYRHRMAVRTWPLFGQVFVNSTN